MTETIELMDGWELTRNSDCMELTPVRDRMPLSPGTDGYRFDGLAHETKRLAAFLFDVYNHELRRMLADPVPAKVEAWLVTHPSPTHRPTVVLDSEYDVNDRKHDERHGWVYTPLVVSKE